MRWVNGHTTSYLTSSWNLSIHIPSFDSEADIERWFPYLCSDGEKKRKRPT